MVKFIVRNNAGPHRPRSPSEASRMGVPGDEEAWMARTKVSGLRNEFPATTRSLTSLTSDGADGSRKPGSGFEFVDRQTHSHYSRGPGKSAMGRLWITLAGCPGPPDCDEAQDDSMSCPRFRLVVASTENRTAQEIRCASKPRPGSKGENRVQNLNHSQVLQRCHLSPFSDQALGFLTGIVARHSEWDSEQAAPQKRKQEHAN